MDRAEADHDQLPEEANEEFRTVGYTIGGMMIWPGNRVDGMTINGSRGFYRRIADRMDLTPGRSVYVSEGCFTNSVDRRRISRASMGRNPTACSDCRS